MSYERGWPFSLVDQLRDLRYDVSQHGFVRGFPTWIWGQASRVGEVAKASRDEGREEARARRGNSGWNWNLFRGWHFRARPGVPTGLAIIIAFIWFYLRLFLIVVSLVFFILIAPLYGLLGIWTLLTGGSLAAVAVAGLVAVIGLSLSWWLQSSDAETRPTIPQDG